MDAPASSWREWTAGVGKSSPGAPASRAPACSPRPEATRRQRAWAAPHSEPGSALTGATAGWADAPGSPGLGASRGPPDTNFAHVTATPEEVILDCALNLNPFQSGRQEVQVTQRLIVNFSTAKRLL